MCVCVCVRACVCMYVCACACMCVCVVQMWRDSADDGIKPVVWSCECRAMKASVPSRQHGAVAGRGVVGKGRVRGALLLLPKQYIT